MAFFFNFSLQMMFDNVGQPAPGALAYFYAPDTLAALTVYRESSLLTPWNQPVAADGYGVFPAVYLDNSAATTYRVQITDADGTILRALTAIPMQVGSGGGGGGGTVDASTIASTGDHKWRPSAELLTGWVRANGKTISSASGSGTERQNADCNALFLWLWTNFPDTVCAVGGGRGATAAADWGSNKAIALLDMRGRSPAGLDDMGNTNAGRIGAAVSPTGGTQAGAAGGASTVTLSVAQLPVHTPGLGTLAVVAESAHTHGIGSYVAAAESAHTHGIGSYVAANESAHTHGAGSFAVGGHTHSVDPPVTTSTTESADHTHAVTIGTLHGTGTWNVMSSLAPSDGSLPNAAGTLGASNTHTHNVDIAPFTSGSATPSFSGTSGAGSAHTHTLSGTSAAGSSHTHTLSGTSGAGSSHTHALSGALASVGSGNAVTTLSPTMVGTWFCKL